MKKKHKSLRRTIEPYLFIAPAIILLCVFTIYPIFRSVYLSLMETDPSLTNMTFVGLKNYIDAFTNPVFWEVVDNTIVYGVAQVLLTTVLGIVFALIANSKRVRFRGLFKVATFYPYILPWTVAAMIWIYMYNPTRGIINSLLDVRIQWLNDYNITLWALIIVCIWKTVGFNFLLFLAGLQNIPAEMYEAAKLETNSGWKVFWKITMPMLSPTTFVAVLLSIVGCFQSVDLIYIMTEGRPGNSTNTLIYYIYQQGIVNWDIGYGNALSTILFIALLVFTIIYVLIGDKKVNYER